MQGKKEERKRSFPVSRKKRLASVCRAYMSRTFLQIATEKIRIKTTTKRPQKNHYMQRNNLNQKKAQLNLRFSLYCKSLLHGT